jgi:hypothetical protein
MEIPCQGSSMSKVAFHMYIMNYDRSVPHQVLHLQKQ